jgi:hypothetical protein
MPETGNWKFLMELGKPAFIVYLLHLICGALIKYFTFWKKMNTKKQKAGLISEFLILSSLFILLYL